MPPHLGDRMFDQTAETFETIAISTRRGADTQPGGAR